MLKAMKNSEAVALPANRMASQSENPEKEKKKKRTRQLTRVVLVGASNFGISALFFGHKSYSVRLKEKLV